VESGKKQATVWKKVILKQPTTNVLVETGLNVANLYDYLTSAGIHKRDD
jgi:hypothetical protein